MEKKLARFISLTFNNLSTNGILLSLRHIKVDTGVSVIELCVALISRLNEAQEHFSVVFLSVRPSVCLFSFCTFNILMYLRGDEGDPCYTLVLTLAHN